MQTKLAVFCDRLIEAGWLAVAVMVPLFFNVYSNRVFEPDKLTLFRGIALIMIVAWVIKVAEDWSLGDRLRLDRNWLTQGALLRPFAAVFALVYVMTTLTSIDPGVSFWGSYQRLQGTLNNLLYVAVFFLTLQHLRTKSQLERLMTVVILTSIPISAYALIQHFGMDPLPWGGDVKERVTSSMGNAIFLSAYLIMVVPLNLSRLFRSIMQYWKSQTGPQLSGTPWISLILVTFYMAVLVLHLVVILYTQSRGPWLGMLAGLGIFALLVLWRFGRRKALLASALILVMMLASIVLLNHSGSPLYGLRRTSPYLERLGTIMDLESGTNKVRLLIWAGDDKGKGALGLITASAYRFLVGYGPETMYVAYNAQYPPDLAHYEARNASPDRSHNDILDFLVTMGLLGLLAHLAVLGAFSITGVRCLWQAQDRSMQLVVIGFMSAVVAHFVEAFFGIAIASTRTHYWLYLAVIAAIPTILRASSAERATIRLAPAALPVATPVPAKQKPGLALRPSGDRSVEASHVRPGIAPGQIANSSRSRRSRQGRRQAQAVTESKPAFSSLRVRLPLNLSAIPILVYLIASLVGTPAVLLSNVGQRIEPPQLMAGGFAWLVIGMLATAVWVDRLQKPRITWMPALIWLYVPTVVVAAFVILYLFLGSVIADIYFKKGQAYDNAGRFEGSVPAYLDALKWADTQDFYLLFLGRSYLELAKKVPDQASPQKIPQKVDDLFGLDLTRPQLLSRDLLFNASLVALKRAMEINPLNTDNSANLARMHRFWAESSTDAAKRKEHFDLADDYYRQATALSPNAAHLFDEWGVVFHLQGRYPEAVEKYQRALYLDDKYSPTFVYLGDAYLAQNRLDEASDMYRRGLALDPTLVGAHSALGYIYQKQGKLQEALAENLQAAQISPNDLVTHRNLAVLFNDLGDYSRALTEAETALRLAPKDQQPPLQAFIDQLKQRRP